MMTDDDGSSSRSPLQPEDFDIAFNLLFPVSSVSPYFSDIFRDFLANLSFPQTITESLIIQDLNFTTWCYPNSTGGLQWQCEDQFGWSCDKCEEYGSCSDVISQTCGCIKGLPPGGEFCEPITNMAPCLRPCTGMKKHFVHLFAIK
ncbi:adhesion G protein-coupled receptor F5 [Oreochromis aureus]|uniref:adhesion G protein-coupled receptor F5 n=1 Tax=Oreochromis aureus TaxID=47969 RepID=UPI001952DF47|nr:adhesion G protein-coupled receptor F5 [Oreochromis aureus]